MSRQRMAMLRETCPHPRLTHGEARSGHQSPEWRAYHAMKQSGPVCERWQTYSVFLDDVGRRPTSGHNLSRLDDTQPFDPANVAWLTSKQVSRNKKNAVKVFCRGEHLNVKEWSERSGVQYSTIRARLASGWDAEAAIFTDVSITENLKRAWSDGRIAPRKPIYTEDELRERKKESARRAYVERGDELRERARVWRKNNKERKRQIQAAYGARNKERLIERAREQRKDPKHRDYMRTYLREHRNKNRAAYRSYGQARRAKQSGVNGIYAAAEWEAKLAAFDHRCAYCGCGGQMTVDHDVPLSRGGSNTIDNIVPACRPCNTRKNDMTAVEYFARLSGEGNSMTPRWAAQLAAARDRSRRGPRS